MAKKDMKVVERPRPLITEPADVVIKVTTTCICGSGLHVYVGFMPGMKSGDVVGHEFMGIHHRGCRSRSEELQEGTAGLYGYSHLTGGSQGGQAEYVRVPLADNNCLKVPQALTDEQVVFLSDILPTGWHANELARVGEGDKCGHLGRWTSDRRTVFCEPGAISCGWVPRSGNTGCQLQNPIYKVEVTVGAETDTSEIVNELVYCVRKGGRIGIVGDYVGYSNHFNLEAFMEKGLTMGGGQVYIQKYWPVLLPLIESGKIDPTIVITHILPLGEAPKGYQIFDDTVDECIKVLLKPQIDPGAWSRGS